MSIPPVAQKLSDLARDFEAVDIRHDDVEKDQIRSFIEKDVDALMPGLG